MNIKAFLKVVEIQTKVASMIPYLIGIIFASYHYREFNLINSLLYIVSLLSIDMATTAINNYMDHKKAIVKVGYNYEEHNGIVANQLTNKSMVITIITLISIGTIAGLVLVFRSDLVVLVIGFISFGIGIIYSAGPIPLSRTPFGELFSGVMMGGVIFFIAVYVQLSQEKLIVYEFMEEHLTISLNYIEFIYIIIVAIPLVAGIANIMLANNICDLEEDIKNKRYTLPCFIGKKNALLVFSSLYYIGYLAVILGMVIKVLPIYCVLVLFTFPLIYKQIKVFMKKQIKEETFVISVKNFMLFGTSYMISLGIGLLFSL